MEELVLLDSGILIEYFRKLNKSKTSFVKINKQYENVAMSSVSFYEVERGILPFQADLWDRTQRKLAILDFEKNAAFSASEVYNNLKKRSLLIPEPDILIAAVALSNDIFLATFNRSHFDRIDGLKLLDF